MTPFDGLFSVGFFLSWKVSCVFFPAQMQMGAISSVCTVGLGYLTELLGHDNLFDPPVFLKLHLVHSQHPMVRHRVPDDAPVVKNEVLIAVLNDRVVARPVRDVLPPRHLEQRWLDRPRLVLAHHAAEQAQVPRRPREGPERTDDGVHPVMGTHEARVWHAADRTLEAVQPPIRCGDALGTEHDAGLKAKEGK